jgi:16S rRNA (adenine1518-N6/adenine1519-N6)-dimethyltransferase
MSSNTLQPKKSLGQHFLHSPSVLAKIIEAANIKSGEKVLEIGPGTGILTEELLKTDADVIAVEKDARAIDLLKEKFSAFLANGKLSLISGDILEINAELEEGKYALVANIPYYITGAILEKFLEHSPRPNRIILLVQKEVAERIVARDGKESILSISVKAFGKPRIIATVPRGAFVPPPTVDSAILEISDISDSQFCGSNKPHIAKIERFFQIVKAGFAHKRKVLIKNLEIVMKKEELEQIWERNKLDKKVRAEDLKVGDWVGICTNL